MPAEDFGGEVVNFAERAKLAEERDQFLAASPRNRLLHQMPEGPTIHDVTLIYCPAGGIQALSMGAQGASYWIALRAALEKLPEAGYVRGQG